MTRRARRFLPAAVLAAALGAGGGAAGEPAVAARPVAPALPNGAAEAHEVALPRVLSEEDAQRYRAIFRLHEQGDWPQANREIARLKDRRLVGHVLAQRYLARDYLSPYHELAAWLGDHGDHPQAARIHQLALKRKPVGANQPRAPAPPPTDARGTEAQAGGRMVEAEADSADLAEPPAAPRDDGKPAARDDSKPAARANPRGPFESRADGSTSAPRTASAAAATAWDSGIEAWRHRRHADALKHFAQVASAADDPWLAAAGAFWAARAARAGGEPRRGGEFLAEAAKHPRTFYGMLARHTLGLEPQFDWRMPRLSAGDLRQIAQQPRALRALALIEVGRRERAELELRLLAAEGGLTVPLLALAERLGMPALALDLGQRLLRTEGRALDGALYPVLAWLSPRANPRGPFADGAEGFASAPRENQIDAALVHALVRQESGFRVFAVSTAGARGLMQLMPATARFVARANKMKPPQRDRLYEPEFNLQLGQLYIGHLLADAGVGRNLFKLAAAYNGGPGNLRRWERDADYRDDPLLFLASLPSRETRAFVERVMANLWVYRARFGQKRPSLDALAAGAWPDYDPQGDGVRKTVNYVPR